MRYVQCNPATGEKTVTMAFNLEDTIRDMVLDWCTSNFNTEASFLREESLTLERIQTIARAVEAADSQAAHMEGKPTATVNYVKHGSGKKPVGTGPKCYRCGQFGHIARDCECSKNRTCEKCGKQGHFAVMCKTKANTSHSKKRVYYVQSEAKGKPSCSSDDDDVF